jgi:hypothetical protein
VGGDCELCRFARWDVVVALAAIAFGFGLHTTNATAPAQLDSVGRCASSSNPP